MDRQRKLRERDKERERKRLTENQRESLGEEREKGTKGKGRWVGGRERGVIKGAER